MGHLSMLFLSSGDNSPQSIHSVALSISSGVGLTITGSRILVSSSFKLSG